MDGGIRSTTNVDLAVDRGAKFIVRALREAGYEVIYTGIRRTPEQIVRSALDEDVDAIGLSLLSGAHNELLARVAALLEEQDAQNIVLLAGGTIPEKDIPYLKSLGFRRVFTPGTALTETGALLEYVATRAPDASLVPTDPDAAGHMRGVMYYLASTMHVAHAHKMRGHRWADQQSSFDDMTAKVPQTMAECAAYIE
ncbi:hypothetical protein LCGC14_1935950, partial [marine sediment metagenome]